MAKLRDIMTTRLVTVAPSASLREVAETLSAEGISGLPVVSGDRLMGVVSAMDLIDFGSTVPSSAELDESAIDLRGGSDPDQYGADSGPPPSFFAEWYPGAAPELIGAAGGEEPSDRWEALEEHTAEEIMTRRLCTLPPDTPLREAAQYMIERGVHRVLVVEDDRLIGLASTMDFVRAVAEGRVRPA